ncbi:S-layer homology domain-containing protein [Saccharibacillus alkalitolerans]|uniref:S-layer homology domain-containing protein n=1 Tax=Saccharibacillus alkalitolerans TaxID=2705290 RepID=A0ABX0FA93_9BACL|nr:S-layer homology domain-containing protein [Saccharibacillus alkalitolerans]NGZ76488.1 S-layer homology domain-containing protein [Saccharibacillus alkalitolerans]
MKKKFAASLMSLSILTASIGVSAFAAAPTPFNDLNNVDGREKIRSLQEQGIIKGVSANAFAPKASVTQAQALQFISNGLGLAALEHPDVDKSKTAHDLFPAVKNDAWYAAAFLDAAASGVSIPKTVDPSAKITREAYVDYLMDALKTAGGLPMINILIPEIADQEQFDIETLGSTQLAIALEIVQLDADKKFRPQDEISRAEAAVMLYNAIDYMKQMKQPMTIMPIDDGGMDILPIEE